MITNNTNIPLPLAVWAVHDDYDYVDMPNYVSATRLLKPIKQLILGSRVPKELIQEDVSDYISRAFGHTIHAAIEKAWLNGYIDNLTKLGYPKKVIESIKINVPPEKIKAGDIPVYIEQRAFRQCAGYTIGGKYDMVAEGIVHDFKSTSAYSWVFEKNNEDYKLQMSIYRWLNPKVITSDFGRICYIFTDWQKAQARSNPNYPQSRLEYVDIPLLSLNETENFIRTKLQLIQKYSTAVESDIPECTDEELWRTEPSYKYYADATKISGRSTKNFKDLTEARQFQASKGGIGTIITVPGEVKRCAYCSAAPICTQRLRYENDRLN